MIRVTALKDTLTILLFTCLSISYQAANAQVGITFVSSQEASDVTVDLLAYGFTDMLSAQFTIAWNPDEFEFVEVQNMNLPALNPNLNFGYDSVEFGRLTFSWFDPDLSGITMPPCSTLFSMQFQSHGPFDHNFTIEDNPTAVEFINIAQEELELIPDFGCSDLGEISGQVFNDLDDNCLYDLGESGLREWIVRFESAEYTFYRSTDENGDFLIHLPPDLYDISLILPQNGLWSTCQPVQNIDLSSNGMAMVDFPAQAILDCPFMTVDLAAPFLRRCFDSQYYVQYCNQGTVTATDAYIEVTFDPFLEVESSTIPWTSADGQTYTFPVGDVEVGECGGFAVTIHVDCDAVLGQSHCSEAHIYPDTVCIPTNPLWDGSDMKVTGSCDGDTVRFQIINLGEDMEAPLEFIVIEDDMIYLTGPPIQLNNMATTTVAMEANGATWRVEIPENENNPFSTFAGASVEGCGTNNMGSFSLGFVTQFPQNAGGPFIDVDCQENIGAYDPNDKTGFPKGFCEAHYIRTEQDIEYRIRFQNTGTDTAFNIAIHDTLPPTLDPSTIRPGAASHPYAFELSGEGVVTFNFPSIMLPDSNVNEAASHGFVSFTIGQQPGNPAGTVIRNQANIVFDFNDPIYTNYYRHTVGDNFVEMVTQQGDLSVSGNVSSWNGEPLENAELTLSNLCPAYSDAAGNFIFENVDTADYILSAFRENDDMRAGVTVLDILKTRSHILGFTPFGNFYQLLAGDLNGNGALTTLDMVIQAKMILGTEASFGTEWKFLIAGATGGTLVDTYEYDPLDSDLTGQDFIAIKPGDVIHESMVELSDLEPEYYLEPASFTGDTLRVDMRVRDFVEVNGFQFDLQWDASALELAALEPATFTENELNWIHSPEPGSLYTLWFGPTSGTGNLPDETTLFTLVFNALAPNGTGITFSLDEDDLPFQTVVEDCKLAQGIFQDSDITIEDPTSLVEFTESGLEVKISPNPMVAGQPLNLVTTGDVSRGINVSVFDLWGKQLILSELQLNPGKSQHRITANLIPGIYLVRIEDGNGGTCQDKLLVY